MVDKTSPVQIKKGTRFQYVVGANTFTFAIDIDGNLWGWGSNRYGMLGDGTTSDKITPVKITFR